MKSFSFKVLDRRAWFAVVAAALLIATIVPSIVSAAQLTERSISLSNSSASATNVTYGINFKSNEPAGAFIVDFCSNSPLLGQACDTPAGFSATAASSATSGFIDVADLDSNTVRVTGTIAAATGVTVALAGINNPSTAGPLYARIVTYDTAANADLYVSTATTRAGSIDDGGAAISITNSIGVSGAVLESMTFCVSGAIIAENCVVNPQTPPTLKLGVVTGDIVALSPEQVSTGSIFTQISTNAVNGAVVSLKSSAAGCGGLKRAGAPTACDISPALATDITPGQAKFGVKTATAINSTGVPVEEAVGTFAPVTGSNYNNTTYALNYTAGDATGVTSTYGDFFLDTAGAPANNKNMQLTFGASISNNTPAGLYSVDLGLIATGKF